MFEPHQTCRAAVFVTPGEALDVRELAIPEPVAGEIRLRVECCTICASDLHSFAGRRPSPTNIVLGHEIVGRVDKQVDQVACFDGEPPGIGDRVVFSIVVACKACRSCRRGFPQKCQSLFKYGHHKTPDRVGLRGGLAEQIVLFPGTDVFAIEDTIPSWLAATATCTGATAQAARRMVGELAGRQVLVCGAGMLGVWMTAICLAAGAKVVVAEPRVPRQRSLLKLESIYPECIAALPEVADVDRDHGFDAIFEASGKASPSLLLEYLATGGQLVLLGHVSPCSDDSINPEHVVRNLHQIIGVHNYAPSDLSAAIAFLEEHWQILDTICQPVPQFPLQQVNAALEAAESGEFLRVAVVPG